MSRKKATLVYITVMAALALLAVFAVIVVSAPH